MAAPTFLVLGVAKAGTTSLYHYLKQHPQIYLNPQVKEPNFFAFGETSLAAYTGPAGDFLKKNVVTDWDAYQALFAGMTHEVACGELSVTNILPRACGRIKDYLPEARLIVLLRQPAERAYSHFLNLRRVGWEPLTDFRAALAVEEKRCRQYRQPLFAYSRLSYYHADLQRFFATFETGQIRVYLYEEWQTQPAAVLQDLFRFIGVDAEFLPDMAQRYNTGSVPRSWHLLHWLRTPGRLRTYYKHLLPPAARRTMIRRLLRYNTKPPPPLDPATHAWLTARYQEDILQLQSLLQRDLSHWLVTGQVTSQ